MRKVLPFWGIHIPETVYSTGALVLANDLQIYRLYGIDAAERPKHTEHRFGKYRVHKAIQLNGLAVYRQCYLASGRIVGLACHRSILPFLLQGSV